MSSAFFASNSTNTTAPTYRHHKKAPSSFGLLATAATAAVLSVSSFTTTLGSFPSLTTAANAFSASTTDDSPEARMKQQRGVASSLLDKGHRKMRASMPDPTDKTTRGSLECNACVAVAHEMFVYMYDLKTSRGDGATTKKESSGAKKKNSKKKSHVPYAEWVERMEEVCPFVTQNYGLKVDEATGRPTLEFGLNAEEGAAGVKTLPVMAKGTQTKKSQHRQIAGGWIQNILTETCARISDNYENEIIRFMESSAVPTTPYSDKPEDNRAMIMLKNDVMKADNDLQHLVCVQLDHICLASREGEGDL